MNLKKKIVAMGMVCALALGVTTSVFASDTRSVVDGFYQRVPKNNTALCLNVNHATGDYSKLNGLAITLYDRSKNEDHNFKVTQAYGGRGTYIYSQIKYNDATKTGYVLNRDDGDAHCILYDATVADPQDSAVIVKDAGTPYGYFELRDGARLTAPSASKNARVYWSFSGSANSQSWTSGE